jgi:hypothetical protein
VPLFRCARRRPRDREARLQAAVVGRLDRLGPNWHIVDWPHAGFLVIGPGGAYAVTILDPGRSRLLVAGDVIQINGQRPPYVSEARRTARHASRALSAATDREVPVKPVLAIVGSGVLSVHGLPRGVLVATEKDLDRLLIAGGARLSPAAASRITAAAADPATWANAHYYWDRDDRP